MFSRKYLRAVKSAVSILFNIPYLYRLETYSQEGEDIILRKLLGRQKKGFYVDIGAHHPFRYSNTFWFYKRGWRGLNIDPMPGTTKLFNRVRPKDKAIEAAVGKTRKLVTYYIFEDSALNTFDHDISQRVQKTHQSKLVKTVQRASCTLASILDKNVGKKKIDLLNIDAEGMDLEILASNNWKKYAPKIVCVEVGTTSAKINAFLKKRGYRLVSKLYNSAIFAKNNIPLV